MTQQPMDTLQDLLESRQYRLLRAAFADRNEVDVAQFIETLPAQQATIAFRTLPKDTEMDVFAELSAQTQQHIIEAISDAELSAIVEELMVDDAVDMLGEMPANLVKRVLRNSLPETRRQLNQFLRYPENSAGSIMTAEFTDLKRTMTVEDAIKRIRRTGEDRETIYTCYVIDETRHLQGVVTMKDLLLAHDTEKVEALMETGCISVSTAADKEQAAKLLLKYGLYALPVTDAENRLVGIVTVDDAVDVLRQEDTEDFEKMAAMRPSEKPYLKTGVFTLAKNRLPWLFILMISGLFTGAILAHYNILFVSVPVLRKFITMLNGTGGNAGSQSSTMVIRGMALGEIHPRDLAAVLWKEARVGLLVGTGLAALNFVRMLFTDPGQPALGLLVSLTLVAAVLTAKMIGAILPLAARVCRVDPALVAAPMITTIVDALVLVLYANFATALFL